MPSTIKPMQQSQKYKKRQIVLSMIKLAQSKMMLIDSLNFVKVLPPETTPATGKSNARHYPNAGPLEGHR